MTKKRKTVLAVKSEAEIVPVGAGEQIVQAQAEEGYEKLDNQYEAAGFAISTFFRNWKKVLIIIICILIVTGLILLLLLPGYKCQTETGSFEKTPVTLPGKGHKPVSEGYQPMSEGN